MSTGRRTSRPRGRWWRRPRGRGWRGCGPTPRAAAGRTLPPCRTPPPTLTTLSTQTFWTLLTGRGKKHHPKLFTNRPSLFTCIVRRLICCGVIFIGEHGEVMLDTRFYKSCSGPRPCPVKTGDPQPSPDTMTDIADSASDYCETYDTENREFYNEETKKGKSDGEEVPTYGQLDPNLETFSTCDS